MYRIDKPEEELAVYNELSIRFGNEESPGIREHVACRYAGGFLSEIMLQPNKIGRRQLRN